MIATLSKDASRTQIHNDNDAKMEEAVEGEKNEDTDEDNCQGLQEYKNKANSTRDREWERERERVSESEGECNKNNLAMKKMIRGHRQWSYPTKQQQCWSMLCSRATVASTVRVGVRVGLQGRLAARVEPRKRSCKYTGCCCKHFSQILCSPRLPKSPVTVEKTRVTQSTVFPGAVNSPNVEKQGRELPQKNFRDQVQKGSIGSKQVEVLQKTRLYCPNLPRTCILYLSFLVSYFFNRWVPATRWASLRSHFYGGIWPQIILAFQAVSCRVLSPHHTVSLYYTWAWYHFCLLI